MKSWKTTVGGIGAILAAVGGALSLLFDNNPATNPDWTGVVSAVTAGVGLIFARDNDKTSEDVKAK
jgi:ABC-type cobalamin transport system permease subunit